MAARGAQSGRRRPVQARSRETVAVILDGAAQVFAERGYAATTTNHIAVRAGVSVGSIYQYFPNKDALLTALLERHVEAAGAAIAALIPRAAGPEQDVAGRLRPIVERVVALHAEDPELHRVLLLESPRLPELVARLHRLEDALAEAVSSALQRAFGLAPEAAARASYLVVHVVELMAHEYVVHPPASMDAEAFVDELVTMLAAYLDARRA